VDSLDSHSSFIETPQQLIVVILLAFLVPILGIVMVVQLVLSRPSAEPGAMIPEAVAARIQPVGRVEFGAGGASAGARGGEEIVTALCAACHQAGVANAPKLGDKAQWAPRLKQGLRALVAAVVKGKGAMPPKAGDASLTDEEITRAVVVMANQAGAKFKEPASSQTAKRPALADGRAVYDQTCVACHAQSVAGSPKLGDTAAWAPRIKTGTDSLLQSVLKGKGAMPPKGGIASLTEAQVRAAVEFMVSQSK